MGTKNNPGTYDCYANAEPDEPMFVLLGRDRLAPWLVQIWALIRAGNRSEAKRTFNDLIERPESAVYVLKPDGDKAVEASQCASAMVAWRVKNRPEKVAPVAEYDDGNADWYED